jgi:microcystin-dependent protein
MKTHAINLVLVFLLFGLSASAQDSGNVIPFQGQLAGQGGQPITMPSPVTIVFRLYQTPVGGVALWEEAQPNISVNAGRFSVLLGSRNALPAYSTFNATLYLGLTVDDGDPQTTDVEMRPRQALVPVMSASYAREADKLRGLDWSILFGSGDPATSPLLDSRIADASIRATKIQPESIHAGLLVRNTITADQIAPHTITTDQIAPSSLFLSALAKQIIDRLVPPGTIVAFGGHSNKVPDGWLLCDGRALSSSQYRELYLVIGTNWGLGLRGVGNLDFNVPDLRGMFLRGVNYNRDDGYGDSDATSRKNAVPVGNQNTGGVRSGNSGPNVGSVQGTILPTHIHRWGFSNFGDQFSRELRSWDAAGSETIVLRDYGQVHIEDGDNDQQDNFKEVTPGINNLNLWTDRQSGQGVTGGQVAPPNAYVNYIIKH